MRPGHKLVGDITYIPTWEGWLYLATVIDCYSKKVIAHAIDDHYRTSLITAAIRGAAATGLADQAIFHTDRGATTPPPTSIPPSPTSDCATRSAGPASVTITRWPSHSSRP